MVEKVLLGVFSLGVIGLAGCTNENADSTDVEEETEVTAADYELEEEGSDVMEMSFEDGKLTAEYVEITIDETQVAHDYFNDEDGLIIWYTIKNTSEDNIVPSDEFSMFDIKQQDDTSEYDITENEFTNYFDAQEALYPTEDENGDLPEDSFEQAVDQQDKFTEEYLKPTNNELLPGKTVQAVYSVGLDDTENPISIKLQEDYPAPTNETYKINLN